MNQSIQVLDGFTYIDAQQAMRMEAMSAGQLITCYISDIEKAASSAFYDSNQFDIEEALVDLIEDQGWNEQGEVWISALDINI